MLYRRGYSKTNILELFRFIDWVMLLPDDIEAKFSENLRQFEEEIKMPYVTSVERRGIQQGLQQGLQQGIQQGLQKGLLQKAREGVVDNLEARFESVPPTITKQICSLQDMDLLKMLHRKAATVNSMEEFQKILRDTLKP